MRRAIEEWYQMLNRMISGVSGLHIQISTLPLPCCVALAKLFNFSKHFCLLPYKMKVIEHLLPIVAKIKRDNVLKGDYMR